jgi:hypothetical protein
MSRKPWDVLFPGGKRLLAFQPFREYLLKKALAIVDRKREAGENL